MVFFLSFSQLALLRSVPVVLVPPISAFLPGSYASFMLYAAYKRWPGYDYSQVPSYDD